MRAKTVFVHRNGLLMGAHQWAYSEGLGEPLGIFSSKVSKDVQFWHTTFQGWNMDPMTKELLWNFKFRREDAACIED
ncbi:hypothetical protein ACN38_g7305 [Penicillium nordicum]|uniref:Uncharacterized protein n=1 Tax=Penicillium nordicum TaxID=229535 RepID=A0A0M8P5P4_9EURO|nr:hypothetical protein ACN38_g7305 [Penicillium nordicum]